MVGDARPSTRDALLGVMASHDQFLGWMAADLGTVVAADRHYRDAGEIAHHLDDKGMGSTIRSMRSRLAWLTGDARRALTLVEGVEAPGSSVGAMAEQQRARAYAMNGDRRRMITT